jgi:4-hydroxy-tetrahydrodipicolinate synthase
LSRILVEQNAGRIPTIIGVAGVTKEVTVAFTHHANDIGADGVIAMTPYIEHVSGDLIFDYYQAISDTAQLPILSRIIPRLLARI